MSNNYFLKINSHDENNKKNIIKFLYISNALYLKKILVIFHI